MIRCHHPKTVPDPRYPDEREYITVPCGKCAACIKSYTSMWSLRLEHESNSLGRHYFMTYTYSTEMSDYMPEHITSYLKSIRQKIKNKFNGTIRYFLVGERGSLRGRVHYHAIIYTDTLEDCSSILCESWSHGFTKVGTVTPKSCSYVAKYIIPTLNDDSKFMRFSKGIGRKYINKDSIARQSTTPKPYLYKQGFRRSLPRYYRKKFQEHGIVFPRFIDSWDKLLDSEYEYLLSSSDGSLFGKTVLSERNENEQRLYDLELLQRKKH